MSTMGLTLLLPFAGVVSQASSQGLVPAPWALCGSSPGGAASLCACLGQLPLAEQRGVISASGLVPRV